MTVLCSLNEASNSGDYQYGDVAKFLTWLESAGFAVVEKIQRTTEVNRQVRAANSLSLWEVTAKDIKYFKKGSKWIGFAGPAGDYTNLGFITSDWMVNGLILSIL